MNTKLIKEIFIYILLFMVIIFTIGLLFYDCIPQNSESIESVQYAADKEVAEALQQIKANSGLNATEDSKDSLLKSYSIGKEDLSEFASENYYESGKKDPFAEYTTPVEEEVVKTVTTTGSVNNVQADNKVQDTKGTATNTVTNTVTNTAANTVANTISSTSTSNNKNETAKNTTKEEVKESSTGTYFEKKNSK